MRLTRSALAQGRLRRSRSRTGTKQDRSTLPVVDGSPAPACWLCRGYSSAKATIANSSVAQRRCYSPLSSCIVSGL